jgi:hypothetical protein
LKNLKSDVFYEKFQKIVKNRQKWPKLSKLRAGLLKTRPEIRPHESLEKVEKVTKSGHF